MFTGLVEEVGRVVDLRRDGDVGTLDVACQVVQDGTAIGDSIAVNGVCLTVVAQGEGSLSFEVMGETFDRSTTGALQPGDGANLERALQVGARLGGHVVQGHVDGVAAITAIEPHGQWTTITYDLPQDLWPFVVEKGSITVDGTSLTVMGTGDGWFSVGLIPHTLEVTTHGRRQVGDRVNLEVDVIAKYVDRQLRGRTSSPYTTQAA